MPARFPSRRLGSLAVLAALSVPACAARTERGQALYQQGRHIEAAEVFELTEGRLAASSSDECACYGLYRGLNFLKLGDLRSARHWLKYTDDLEKRQPGMLSTEERQLLARGWQELEARDRVARMPRNAAGFTASGASPPDPARAPTPARDPGVADQ